MVRILTINKIFKLIYKVMRRKKRRKLKTFFASVPRAGIEPAWRLIHWCLRPARLPIPPSGLKCGAKIKTDFE